MSTSAPVSPPAGATPGPAGAPVSSDELAALEQKVLRAVEIVRRERDARASAEAEVARLEQQLRDQADRIQQMEADHAAQREAHATELDHHASTAETHLAALEHERIEVRQRVEKILEQMDELL